MKKIIRITSLYALLCLYLQAAATVNVARKDSAARLSAVLNIIVEDSSLLDEAVLKTETLKGGINSVYSSQVLATEQKVSGKESSYVIPLDAKLAYVRLSYSCRQLPGENFHFHNPLVLYPYLMRDGDTVTVHLWRKEDGVLFTGSTGARMNCMYRIYMNFERGIVSYDKSNSLYAQGRYRESLEARKMQFDSLYRNCMAILEENKGKIDKETERLIRLDCEAQRDMMMVGHFSFTGDEPGLKKEFDETKGVFMKYFGGTNGTGLKDEGLLTASYFYGDFLLRKNIALLGFLKSSANRFERYTIADLRLLISKSYSGALRDKLLLLSFYLKGMGKQGPDGSLAQIPAATGDNIFARALRDFAGRLTVYAPAYDFKLQDEQGKIVGLSDLKGKLLVMDFWFTGCHGCNLMAISLKPIAEQFKDDARIRFVTVSIDRNKEIWQRGLKSGRYTGPDELNLWIGEGAKRSPIVEFYNFGSYPHFLVISKDGRLITDSPPDPRTDTGRFIEFINAHI